MVRTWVKSQWLVLEVFRVGILDHLLEGIVTWIMVSPMGHWSAGAHRVLDMEAASVRAVQRQSPTACSAWLLPFTLWTWNGIATTRD